jgi:hypothetical protein
MAKFLPWDGWFNANDYMRNQHGKILPWENYLYDNGGGDNLIGGHSSHNVPLIAGALGLLTAPSNHRVWSDWYDYLAAIFMVVGYWVAYWLPGQWLIPVVGRLFQYPPGFTYGLLPRGWPWVVLA